MKKLKKHLKKWNGWRKHSLNSKFHKLLVLLGIIKSPTFDLYFTKEELDEFCKELEKSIMQGPSEIEPIGLCAEAEQLNE